MTGEGKIHTHQHDVCRRLHSFLIVLINLLICSMKGRGKQPVFWTVSTTGPCPVKGLKCQNAQMKGWNILRWECLLSIIGVLRSCQSLIWRQNRRCTLSNPRKVFTCNYSSLVSLSSCILSCFAESCSSQRSSSMKASTHYGNQIMNVNLHIECAMYILFSFSTIKH